ncbi:MAG: glycine--tRNA ligase subunit beta [Methylococcales bacterium]|nr:glycine--tRNA ligase subunit beta [Methylococcales bacterium]
MTQHLLFELGSEELPPKNLLKLSNALTDGIVVGLNEAELAFSSVKSYATPRRLAVFIENLQGAQADKTVQKRGPAVQAAFQADGSPSKAALAFAQSCSVEFDQLERLKTDKGEWLACTQTIAGQTTQQLIPDIIRKSIANLPIAKRMRWGSFATEFVRPVHWAILLYGDEIIETEILGLQTGNQTRGHRFHAPQAITIAKPENYAEILFSQGKVIADFEARKNQIRADAEKAASAVNGIAHIEEDLLEEIAALNEFPVPITGHFDERFLALPAEVLITTMQENQKYFPVKNADGSLRPYFITFSNIESTRPASIQDGNERVVTPRLSDAEFFWKQDRRYSLADFAPRLETIVFQEKLGTVAQKVQRLIKLAEYIAPKIGADVELAKRTAFLAKNDLMTEMVGEFGNLQGIMGRYYALADGENPIVAQAIEEHYLPKQAGGATPSSDIGCVVALAEKIDTLAGIFSAGLIPTGDKDPYALRRAALGVLRILIENKLNLNLVELIDFACKVITPLKSDKVVTEFNESGQQENAKLVIDFIFERLKGYCLDKGFTADEFEAVLAVNPAEPLDFMQRLQAVKAFRQLPEAESLAAANKRILNILKKSESPAAQTVGKLIEPVEIELLELAQKSAADIQPLLEKRDYQATLNRLAELKQPVDAFFDGVMVNCDDLELRANRLALLNLLSEQFLTCADISKLQA